MKQNYTPPIIDIVAIKLEGCIAASLPTTGGSAKSDRGLNDMSETDYSGSFDW